MSEIAVVGAGYVGLVTSACFAHVGHRVSALDIDYEKIALLNAGEIPIYEPELQSLVREGLADGNLHFSTDAAEMITGAEYVFIAVQTPGASNGRADLIALMDALRSIAPYLSEGAVIVQKSTVPVGTTAVMEEMVTGSNSGPHSVVANPEFLKEGTAVHDFLHPNRVVIGATSQQAAAHVERLYSFADCPIVHTNPNTAEMIKYAANSFLAAKISFINEIAQICEAYAVDVRDVAVGMGMDDRIGPAFLNAGLGWGGSCLPKDVSALIHMAKATKRSPRVLQAVQKVNANQKRHVVSKLERYLGDLEDKVVGLLGLSFKPGTDDLRSAPSLQLAKLLSEKGCIVRGHDPVAMERVAQQAPEIELCGGPYEVADGADALVLVTEWPEYTGLNMAAIHRMMRKHVVVDGRNAWNRTELERLGFIYSGFGISPSDERSTSPLSAIASLGEVA